jgi:dihydroorotase
MKNLYIQVMQKYLFKDILVVNEGKIATQDVLVEGERIERIDNSISEKGKVTEIAGNGRYMLPGAIDDQVHFREPGLTHKADLYTESRAAVAGGVTSFMEMPNTIPNATSLGILEDKYAAAAERSLANYSFFMGVANNNPDDALMANKHKQDICGIKIFMGSSTGNMLVDNPNTLERIFSESELLIATHCEDETIIRDNYQRIKSFKPNLEPADHPLIRDENACYHSSLYAVKMAAKFNSRLHILHITTEQELQLFGNMMPLAEKRITAEVCVHHLHFTSNDYAKQGYNIKCNPAIKAPYNRESLWKALLDDRLDVIATDHAPHLASEKTGPYEHAHAGLPLVQHGLPLMLRYFREGRISLEKIVEKMSHHVATCFQIKDRGFIREGYFADLVLVDPRKSLQVSKENLLYKCGWSPFEGEHFPMAVDETYVNGKLVYANGSIVESSYGKRLSFNR